MLMRFLIALIILASSFPVYAAKLDRSEINKTLKSIKSVSLTHKGQKGVWFPEADADILLNLVTEKFKLSLDIIDAQEEQSKAQKSAIDSYKLSGENYEKLATYNLNMFDVAMKHIPKLEPPDYSWYEKPGSTFIWGYVAGTVVTIVTAYVAVQAIDNK